MENFCNSREEASLAAAEHIALALARRLEGQHDTSLVVTGGSSPAQCYAALAKNDLEWERVRIVLSDERWVPPTHDDSNEKLVRETLMTGHAENARLLALYDEKETAAERSASLNAAISDLEIPFACVLLGMGDDGHIASLFPDADNLEQGLNVDNPEFFLPVTTAASPYPRISLTLGALTRSDDVLLLFFGDAKRKVYEQAKARASAYPVSKLLFQKRAPVHVFWAP